MNRIGFAAVSLLGGLALCAPVHARSLRVGQKFPTISLPSLDGKIRSVESFRGRKLILHVFASW